MIGSPSTLPTRIVEGPGSVGRLGELAAGLGAQRVFLVTAPGVVAAGHVDKAEAALRAAGVEVRRFDGVPENPDAADVAACRQGLGDWPADLLVGFGGGSAIDAAKGCAFLHAGGGGMEDYWGRGKAKGRLLPLIAVPTTAGTGTEVQSFALIEQEGTRQKMACGDPQATPRFAVLDPELTVTMPRAVTGSSGLDTLTHAVETLVTKARTESSVACARRAFGRVLRNLSVALTAPDDLAARAGMLEASALAGIAIENSMLGAAHALGNPLTAHCGMVHGVAVATVLPAVVRFNGEDPEARAGYADAARAEGLCPPGADDSTASEALAGAVERQLALAGFPPVLAAHGVRAQAVDRLAAEAAVQWTGRFNPRAVGVAEFKSLYLEALGARDEGHA